MPTQSHPAHLFLPVVALLALSLPACAGDAPPAQAPKAAQGTQPGDPAVQIDTDRDGVVSPAELAAFREKQRQEQLLRQAERQLARLDADKDGKVSLAEFAAGTAPRTAPDSPEAAVQREQRSALITERIEARRAQMQIDAAKKPPAPAK